MMSDVAICAEGLSKQYHIGVTPAKYQTLRDSVTSTLSAPLHKLRRNGKGTHENTIWALKDVSFDVKRGEAVGIIGRNGAGKSTLLKILSNITEPTAGYVDIYGRVGSLLEVGTGFHPELTGRENVYLNGAILGMRRSEIAHKFDEIVAFAEIEQFIDTPVKHYSSGMYMRLAFAVAAHLEPEILIVDEVLAVGDAAFQQKCLGKMGEVAGEGRTVLFVSHNLSAVSELTKRAIWLQDGQIVQADSTYQVVQQYLQSFDRFSSGYVDLSERNNTPNPIIRSIEILQSGKTVSSVEMGQSMSFRVGIESQKPIQTPQIGIGIDHLVQGRILSLSTTYVGYESQAKSVQSGYFICDVDELFLNQGTYSVTVSLREGAKDIDSVRHACRFEVVSTDVYKRGRVPSREQGVMYLPHRWSLEERTDE